MPLGKQAKVLARAQVDRILRHVEATRHPLRNRAIVLLSVKAGLRAKEIASLTWDMVSDPDGNVGTAIHLTNAASKGRSGRVIPMNGELRSALVELGARRTPRNDVREIIASERGKRTSPQVIVNLFFCWYRDVGLRGWSSHSGRRTFITNAARKISSVGGSLRDVQALAGHARLGTTQGYIDVNGEAQRKVVDLV
jgi:integrase/recombinase XerD